MLTKEQVLGLVSQKAPFRFIDRLLEIDENHAVGEYTYRPDEYFYAGHFPGLPVTPGAIFIETMGQTAGALLVYLLGLENPVEDVRRFVAMGTDASAEFLRVVRPGETVRARADKVFWRGRKLKSRVELSLTDGTPVSQGTIGGQVIFVKSAGD
jgi:3-hydroxyacyl-[acyl-carrier-protein] dehydratase